MKCPQCIQPIHKSAEACPHCDASVTSLAQEYQDYVGSGRRVYDAAGVLKVKDRKLIEDMLHRAEREFPQLFLGVVTVALKDHQTIQSAGVWMLNCADFGEADESTLAQGGYVIVIEVQRKECCVVHGLLLDPFLEPEQTFHALSGAHPFLLERDYVQSIKVMLGGSTALLRRCARRSKRILKRKGLLDKLIPRKEESGAG